MKCRAAALMVPQDQPPRLQKTLRGMDPFIPASNVKTSIGDESGSV